MFETLNGERKIKTNKMRAGRQLWIDELRGIAMLLVIYGHLCPNWSEYFIFTSPIKIPLFFAITGLCFNFRDGNTIEWLKNIMLKLIWPWFVLSLVWAKILYALFRGNMFGLLSYIGDFVSGKTLWYMPCCIVAEIVHYVVLKISKRRKEEILFSVLLVMGGFWLAHINVGNFMCFNTALIAQFYIEIGGLAHSAIGKANKIFKYKFSIACLCGYIILGVLSMICFTNQVMDVHTNTYYNIPLLLCMAVVGIIGLFFMFSELSKVSSILVFIGQNTLVFYMLNSYAWKIEQLIIGNFLDSIKNTTIGYFVEMVIICFICVIFSRVINRFTPWALGKIVPADKNCCF